jgi:hypothetical protein
VGSITGSDGKVVTVPRNRPIIFGFRPFPGFAEASLEMAVGEKLNGGRELHILAQPLTLATPAVATHPNHADDEEGRGGGFRT